MDWMDGGDGRVCLMTRVLTDGMGMVMISVDSGWVGWMVELN